MSLFPRQAGKARYVLLTGMLSGLTVALVAPHGDASAAVPHVAPASTNVSTVTASPPPGGVPGVRVPAIGWTDAGDGYQRATVPVPYDYRQPGGRSFRLNVVRLPAGDPAHKRGVLFFNFGGPGGGAADVVRAAGRFLLPPEVLARYDVVGVDPRGTGHSQPVRCFGSTEEQHTLPFATLAKFPTTSVERVEAAAQVRRFAALCRARNGDLLDHVGTLQFARDLDVLRAAMGDRRLNLIGLSYGTLLGQVVANTFPTRTGALVLDSVGSPSWFTGPRGTVSWTRTNADVATWQTLRRFFQLCRDAGAQRCAFAAGGDPRRKYAALADRLKAEPLEVPVPGKPPYPVGYSDLVAVSTTALYGRWSWPALGRVLQALYVRDARAAAAAAAEITPAPAPGYDNYVEADLAIGCADTDNPWNPYRYGRVGHRRDRTVAPYAGLRWAYFAQPCAAWQGRSTERHTGPWTARTTNPVLLLNNRYDPATPYRSAVKVHRLLPNSSLLTVDDVGHGAMFNSCASAAISRYLLTGATPAAGTVCQADGAPFEPEPATAARRAEPTAVQALHAALAR